MTRTGVTHFSVQRSLVTVTIISIGGRLSTDPTAVLEHSVHASQNGGFELSNSAAEYSIKDPFHRTVVHLQPIKTSRRSSIDRQLRHRGPRYFLRCRFSTTCSESAGRAFRISIPSKRELWWKFCERVALNRTAGSRAAAASWAIACESTTCCSWDGCAIAEALRSTSERRVLAVSESGCETPVRRVGSVSATAWMSEMSWNNESQLRVASLIPSKASIDAFSVVNGPNARRSVGPPTERMSPAVSVVGAIQFTCAGR